MGGIGSGRYSGFGAPATDDFHLIDLAMMHRRGWTTSGTLTWSRGGCKTGSIGYAMYWHGLQLTYSAGGESIAELVPFDRFRRAAQVVSMPILPAPLPRPLRW
jgi:hypothetical protein